MNERESTRNHLRSQPHFLCRVEECWSKRVDVEGEGWRREDIGGWGGVVKDEEMGEGLRS